MKTESAWIDVTVKAETDKVVLLTNGHREAWIPRSQILDNEYGQHYRLAIALIIAKLGGAA